MAVHQSIVGGLHSGRIRDELYIPVINHSIDKHAGQFIDTIPIVLRMIGICDACEARRLVDLHRKRIVGMSEEKEEAVVFFKDAYLLAFLHISRVASDGGGFPLAIERERLEVDV